MFIAKVFSGYGSLLSMKLYLMLCPIIIGSSITWGSSRTSTEAAYFIKLIFLVGGAWAMLKMGPMISSVLHTQSGQAEQSVADRIGQKAGGAVTGAIGWTAGKAGKIMGAELKVLKQKFSSDMKTNRYTKNKKFTGKYHDKSSAQKTPDTPAITSGQHKEQPQNPAITSEQHKEQPQKYT